MRKHLQISARALCCAAIGALPCLAGAQLATAQESDAESADGLADEARRLGTVTVSARKRDETLSDTPVVLNAYSQDILEQNRIESIDELSTYTPGLLVAESTTSVGGTISLRGIGNGVSGFLVDPTVAINVDGMQVASLNVRKLGQIDLEQVEVLRGPQALFFGKNSPGGVLSLKTRNPGDKFEALAAVGYETESGDRYVEGILSGPLSETVGGRLVARFADLDGYFNLRTVDAPGNSLVIPPSVDQYPQGEETFIRGTLTFQPDDRFSAVAKLAYGDAQTTGGSATANQRIYCPLGVPQGFQPDFPCRKGTRDIYLGGAPAEIIALSPDARGSDGLGRRDNTQYLATIEADFKLTPSLTLSSLTGYWDFDEYNFQNPSVGPAVQTLVPAATFAVQQTTQELRLTSEFDGPLNFMVGAFAEWKESESGTDAVIALPIFPPSFQPLRFPREDVFEDQNAQSIFAQLEYAFSDQWAVSGGARYSQEEKEVTFIAAGLDVTDNLQKPKDSWSNFSPEVTVSYEPSANALLFASYKEGFKSGGIDPGFTNSTILMAAPGSFANGFDEEMVKGFEAGGKWVLADETLSLNVAAYSYEYTDLQVGGPEGDSVATLTFRIRNAAEASAKGIEADFAWLPPIEGMTLRGAAAYNKAEFDSFIAPCYRGQSIAAGCDQNLVAGVFRGQDHSGREINNAPEWTGSLDAVYEGSLSDWLNFTATLGASYSSDYYSNLLLSPQDKQDAWTKLNASLTLFSDRSGWQVSVVGRNLTDEITYNATGIDPFSGFGQGTDTVGAPDITGFPSKGREVFVRLSHRWGR
ncbi:TonB-dependent receptor [Henriciella mobilis]|uniref:TonB-dependent receptor n=1 Tax=Henriciella mobilis TaxID=2305467 RepID=A0A399RHC0_9PROT|nr:TonB-dependent receptor [Henriciella mobilis]RIJ29874.1 TonB-dependent receptor [Henriciella mobilis]